MLRMHCARPTVLTRTQAAAARPTPLRGGPRMTRQQTASITDRGVADDDVRGSGSDVRDEEVRGDDRVMSAATTSAVMM